MDLPAGLHPPECMGRGEPSALCFPRRQMEIGWRGILAEFHIICAECFLYNIFIGPAAQELPLNLLYVKPEKPHPQITISGVVQAQTFWII